MNNFIETVVPCCGSLLLIGLLFGLVAFWRYMNYRETIALAEKGLVKPERRSGSGTLFWGIGLTAVGLALCLGLWPIGFFVGSRFPLGLGPWMLAGLLPMFFGLGLILFYVLTREAPADEKASRPAGPSVAPTGPASLPNPPAAPPGAPAAPPAPAAETPLGE
jgi:hypothetical protein